MSWFKSFKKNPISDYFGKIWQCTLSNTDILRKEWKLTDLQYCSILFEFLYLHLNLTDRAASSILDDKKRQEVMNEVSKGSIVSVVRAVCHSLPEDKIDMVIKDCINDYHVSISEWGACKKMFPQKNESVKDVEDTLFWEFSKSVARLADHDYDFAYICFVTKIALESLKVLDPLSFIASIK